MTRAIWELDIDINIIIVYHCEVWWRKEHYYSKRKHWVFAWHHTNAVKDNQPCSGLQLNHLHLCWGGQYTNLQSLPLQVLQLPPQTSHLGPEGSITLSYVLHHQPRSLLWPLVHHPAQVHTTPQLLQEENMTETTHQLSTSSPAIINNTDEVSGPSPPE